MVKKQLKSQLLIVNLLIAILALGGGAIGCSSSNSLGLISAYISAPDFTLPTMTGTEVTLSALQGQPVVLNFWTTQCLPCITELPYFDTAAKQYSDRVTIVAINIQESVSLVKLSLGDSEVDFIVALDKNAQVASNYAIRYTPSTFFIDSQGVIRYIKFGAFTNEQELQTSIEKLLNEGKYT